MDAHIPDLYSAAPYIARFQGAVFVIKIGGEVLANQGQLTSLVKQVRILSQLGVMPILVHGAGTQLDAAMSKQGIEPEKVQGRRITNSETLEIATQVFRGSANLALVAALRQGSVPAMGMSGVDAGLMTLRKRDPVDVEGQLVDYGLVGDPVSVEPFAIWTLIDAGIVPVICSLGCDADVQILNVNADTIACEIAVAMEAAKLMFVTDKPGILHDADDDESIYSVLDKSDCEKLTSEGVIKGGMLPKVRNALDALTRGVERVHIVGADEPEALVEETFTNQGCGTMLVLSREDV